MNKVYKVVFPILHITSTASNRMREMQEQMREMERRMEDTKKPQQKKRVSRDDDYIDYEELR
ncbi:MAG: hypothetical protein V4649_15430 [Bacteroidota bacterium]